MGKGWRPFWEVGSTRGEDLDDAFVHLLLQALEMSRGLRHLTTTISNLLRTPLPLGKCLSLRSPGVKGFEKDVRRARTDQRSSGIEADVSVVDGLVQVWDCLDGYHHEGRVDEGSSVRQVREGSNFRSLPLSGDLILRPLPPSPSAVDWAVS